MDCMSRAYRKRHHARKTYTKAECKALLNKDLATVADKLTRTSKSIYRKQRAALFIIRLQRGCWQFQNIDASSQNNQGDIKGACDQLRRWTYAGGSNGKVSWLVVRLSVKSVCGAAMNRVTAIISALVICIIVCCHGLLIITVITPLPTKPSATKCQRTEAGERGNYWHADASGDVAALDAKYTKELADAKAEMMLCVMMLPLVVVGCTSKQSSVSAWSHHRLRRG